MKILHVSGATSWGGNEQQMVDLIPELSKLGIVNFVFGVRSSPLQKECENIGIQFIEAKTNKLNKFANYSYLSTLVKELKPDLIHLHTSDSLTVFTISDLLFRLKIKAVFSKKGMGSSSSILSKYKYNYKNIAAIICVSEAVKKSFSKILTVRNKSKISVIHDCVSLQILNLQSEVSLRSKFLINDDDIIVGNIANHTKAKDLETFIDTADYIVNEMGKKNIKFIQVGEFSNLTSYLKTKVIEKKINDYLFFTDKIINASALNKQFDVFLITSEREGGPTSALEAMLLGVPVVTTDVGVMREVIIDGENGFISSVKNYKDLATNVIQLISKQLLKDKFIEINKFKIKEEFNSGFIAKETYCSYQNIIKK